MSKDSIIRKYIANLRVNVLIAERTVVSPGWGNTLHRPAFNRLYYILDGAGYVEVDGVRFEPVPGDLVLLPAKTSICFGTLPDQPSYTKFWVHFDAKVGDLNLFDLIKVPLLVRPVHPETLSALFDSLIQLHREETIVGMLEQQSVMIHILAEYMDSVSPEKMIPVTSNEERINAVIEYIENHIEQSVTVEDLSRLLDLHPNYFIKMFRTHMGLSPLQYINRLKIERAKMLLETEDYNISTISYMLGFAQPSYFAKLFKQFVGRSPKEYRKEMHKRSNVL